MKKKSRSKNEEDRILATVKKQLTPFFQVSNLVDGGHETGHPERMCRITRIIWPKLKTIAGIKEDIGTEELNWFLLELSIWLHNLDRAKNFQKLTPEKSVRRVLEPYTQIREKEIKLIVNAVSKHEFREQPGDHSLLRVLRWCDMLDAMGALGVLRVSRCMQSRGNPLFNPGDLKTLRPRATEAKKLSSTLEALKWTLQYFDLLPKELQEMEFVKQRFAFMKMFLERCFTELRELGIA